MSLENYFMGSECGVDIYEEPDVNVWVDCSKKKYMYGTIWLAIIVVIILVFLFFTKSEYAVSGLVIGGLLLAANLGYYQVILPFASANQWKTTQKEIKSRVDAGMSKADAIREIQKEHLKKQELDARLAQARATQNLAMNYSRK